MPRPSHPRSSLSRYVFSLRERVSKIAANLFDGVSSSVVLLLLIVFASIASSADPPSTSPPSLAPLFVPTKSPSSPPSPPLEPDIPSKTHDSSATPNSLLHHSLLDISKSPLSPTPAPNPSDVSYINHSDANAEADETEKSYGGNMFKTAGIVIGVIAAVCVVGLGRFMYKKCQENIR